MNMKILKGFSIVIGSFKELVNLVHLVDYLQNKYNDCIFIQVSVIQNVK